MSVDLHRRRGARNSFGPALAETPDRWQRIEAIVMEAIERSTAARAAFLEDACGDDPGLRQEAESLLSHAGEADRVLADAVEGSAVLFQSDAPDAWGLGLAEGERIGAYRIIRQIGRGGMGTVYLADRDDEFHKQVAIKLVTRGMDTAALLDRFRHERQILARLEHPYIAHLLDGGSTADGRPYLVMEYVEGQPITAYCLQNRLGTRERIELFRKVCAAVQCAHQNLVVHRDLKPGNILVDAGGVPKLLDFGIAKLLGSEDAPQLTVAAGGLHMLTPDYASPEQVRGGAITTASDVYSLGAILYELLSGVRPHRFRNNNLAEIERAICVDDPERPSTASRRAAAQEATAAAPLQAGDLDNVILMAMQKEPARRYGSAAELSEDLRRYLADLPVQAREDTAFYRAGKFVRRHGPTVAAGLLLVATLAGGVTVSTIEARRAQRRFNEVRSIAHAVLYDVYDAIRDLPASTKAREVVVKTALQYLNGLAREAAGDPGIQLELAEAYLRVGDVQGHATGSSLGRTEEALESYRKAMQIGDELARRRGGSPRIELVRMESRERIGDILAAQKRESTAALKVYGQGAAIGEAAARNDPSNRESLRDLSSLYVSMARVDPNSAGSIASARKALPILERVAAGNPGVEEDRQALSEGYSNLGQGLTLANELGEALEYLRKAVGVRESLAAAHPENARYQRQLMIAYSKVGDVLGPILPSLEDPAGALDNYGKMLAIAEKLAAADPANPRLAYDRAMALLKTANAIPPENGEAAIEMLGQARAIFESLAKTGPDQPRLRYSLCAVWQFLARRQAHAGDAAGALRSYREEMRIIEEMLASGAQDLQLQRALWTSCQELAKAQAAARQRADAIDLARKAIAAAEAARAIDPSNAVTQSLLPQAYATAGAVRATLAAAPGAPAAERREDWTEARDAFQKSAGGWEQIHPIHGWPKDRDAPLAHARAEAARCAAALAVLR